MNGAAAKRILTSVTPALKNKQIQILRHIMHLLLLLPPPSPHPEINFQLLLKYAQRGVDVILASDVMYNPAYYEVTMFVGNPLSLSLSLSLESRRLSLQHLSGVLPLSTSTVS